MSDEKQATPMEAMQAALDHAKWLLKNASVCELSAHNEAVRNWALEWDQRAVNAEAALAAANEARDALRAEIERLRDVVLELTEALAGAESGNTHPADCKRWNEWRDGLCAAAIDAARKEA